ncbi:MAG: leucine-rich repeat domain-containing protein [Holosporales bacterium]|jgi:hypothetical protein|nr:leucine-rich repeat domain-containing protein [Holosporales bacterium]
MPVYFHLARILSKTFGMREINLRADVHSAGCARKILRAGEVHLRDNGTNATDARVAPNIKNRHMIKFAAHLVCFLTTIPQLHASLDSPLARIGAAQQCIASNSLIIKTVNRPLNTQLESNFNCIYEHLENAMQEIIAWRDELYSRHPELLYPEFYAYLAENNITVAELSAQPLTRVLIDVNDALEFLAEEQQTVESLREQSNALVLLNETSMPATPTLANIEHLYLVKNYPTFDITACSKLKTLCFFDGPGLNADQRTAISTLVKNTKQLQKLIIMNWGDNTMAGHAFECDDSSLVYVMIGGFTATEWRVFRICRALTTALFPSVQILQQMAFVECESLTTIFFPEVTTIGSLNDGYGVFQYCSSLEIALFPNAIIIGNNAFSGCTKLQTVSYKSGATIGTDAFKECPLTLQKILVP